jgi:hypothetical protein
MSEHTQSGPGTLRLNPSVSELECPRLTKQCLKILRLFVENRYVSNTALHSLAYNHTARISDLRQNGFDIEMIVYDRETGQAGYRLNGWGKAHLEQFPAITEDEFLSWFADEYVLFGCLFLSKEIWPKLRERIRTVCRYQIEIVKEELTREDFRKILKRNGYKEDEDAGLQKVAKA